MSEQLCPVCGCHVAVDAFNRDGVVYCCEACATGGECDCGCCKVAEEQDK